MKTETVFWEDLVFEFRHKDYGAYPLRRGYPHVVSLAAGLVILLFFGGITGLKQLNQETMSPPGGGRPGLIIKYAELAPPPLVEKASAPPPPKAQVVAPQPAPKKKYVAPKVTTRTVKTPAKPLTVQEIKADQGTAEDVGTGSPETGVGAGAGAAPGGKGQGSGQAGSGEGSGPAMIQRDPEFPGGRDKLMAWLRANLNYPPMAVRMGIEGVVKVSFVVGMTGEIKDVTVVEPLHRLCDKEAVRLISSMPNWIPGEINGKKSIITYAIQICFRLT